MNVLDGKVAIITGASSGIGRATAQLFAREGANVVLVARRRAELDTLVSEIRRDGGAAVAVTGNVKDEATAQQAVAVAKEKFGGLDIAFNNAGITGELGAVPDVSLAGWQDVLATNLTSAFLGVKYQVPEMIERGGGSLIFTATPVGYTFGMPGMAAYGASKAGIIGLTKVVAAEFGPKGVRANAVLPGAVDTEACLANAPGAGSEVMTFLKGLHALKRIARPEEIAQTVLHLASDASSFVTGTAFMVDGGVTICRT